jgi:glycosyltransferase involved in cell wall biosynthesis
MPNVSFLIPSRNSERFIADCLDSILSVIQPGDEIVVLDDSKDSTPQILSSYLSKGPIKVIGPKEPGIMSARLTLLQNASKDYVSFIDADDVIIKEAFLPIRQKVQGDYDIYYFDGSFVDEKLAFVKPYRLFPSISSSREISPDEVRKQLLSDDTVNNLWCRIVRRSLFNLDELQKYTFVKIGEDRKISLSLSEKDTSGYYFPTPAYLYRLSVEGATRLPPKSVMDDYLFLLEDSFSFIERSKWRELLQPFLKTMGRRYMFYLIQGSFYYAENKKEFLAYKKKITESPVYSALKAEHLLHWDSAKEETYFRLFSLSLYRPLHDSLARHKSAKNTKK